MELTQVDDLVALPLPLARRTPVLTDPFEDGCLHTMFETQVDATPFAPAIICNGKTWSYRELDEAANQLAHVLRFYDVGPGQLVGLYFERSQLPIIAILGCLKAGAGYLPIDPVHPKDRIRHMLEESEAKILLTEAALVDKTNELFDGTVLTLDRLGTELSARPKWRLAADEVGVRPTDLAYVLYTSGTTGRPKGVMAEHRNAYRYTLAFNELCRTGPGDRIFQGFSLSFDGSIEEIWMAFSNGSALVIGTKESPRFGDDLARFLTDQKVTYFSTVPTLLSTMALSIPTLRYLVVSGEVCPPEVADRWARGRCRLFNVYGPTEATVNTTLSECFPGKPVTIGRPLPGYNLFILDEQLNQVAPGEKGELYVQGETLARGYLKQPELSATRFVMLSPGAGLPAMRMYRTGDLVRKNADGDLEFFGRIDGQIKIRGYRVELSEIESVLREHVQIRSAVVKLFERDGIKQLGAIVVPDKAGDKLDNESVWELLKRRLPDYMIPSYLDAMDELPTLASGKVDRFRLPDPVTPLRHLGDIVEPSTEMETKLVEAWKKILNIPRLSVDADFFKDLGGHSLLAAQMVTLLRNQHGMDVAIRDAYKNPTVRKLAEYLALKEKETPEVEARPRSSREVFESLSRGTRAACVSLQAASIYLLSSLASLPFLVAFLVGWQVYTGHLALGPGIAVLLALEFVLWPVYLALSIAAKWILIGRYRPGEYPVWGLFYFRWWLANRFAAFSGAGMLSGTPMLPLYYRLMGAKVGRDCSLDTTMVSIWDLVSIGDETSIGPDTQLLGYRVENGMLKIGKVEIGNRCFVGTHSAFGLDCKMEDDTRLDDQSYLPDFEVVAAGEGRRGSPAQAAEVEVPVSNPEKRKRHPVLMSLVQLALIYVMGFAMIPLALAFLGGTILITWHFGWAVGVAIQPLLVPTGVLAYCLYVAALKRMILPRATPGVYSEESIFHLRKWLSDGLIRASRAVLLPLYTTLYLPPFLRLLGAKIGPRAELSTVWYFSPEMLNVEAESFFADGCIIGGKRTFRGSFEIGINHVGKRSFVGNSALLPMGKGLGDNGLLGVLSAPPAQFERTPDGTEWLGCPAFALPNRPKATCFNEAETYRPTKKLYAQRAVIDGLRIVIPGCLGMLALFAGFEALFLIHRSLGVAGLVALMPVVGLSLAVALALSVVLLKVCVMGTFQPVTKPLWSMYVWLNEMVNGVYESVMSPAISVFAGTPFLAPFLRLIGCKVGKRTFIASTLFSEWDLVEIGDYAALNTGAIIQTHLFEDRVMKSSSLKVGDECTVGNMAVVLYDTEMQRGASLAPLSLLMKGERLNPFTRWHGIPTVKVTTTR